MIKKTPEEYIDAVLFKQEIRPEIIRLVIVLLLMGALVYLAFVDRGIDFPITSFVLAIAVLSKVIGRMIQVLRNYERI